jgi:chemotaxis protein CheY-P-specific phosphatase CheC
VLLIQEDQNNYELELEDVFCEIVNVGLGRAAKVISELTECYVDLGLVTVYFKEGLDDVAVHSNYVVIQEIEGIVIYGKTIFSMLDDELLKLLRHIEVIEDSDEFFNADNLDMILDSYQEIGNIVLGNVSSSIINFLEESSEIKLPFVAPKAILKNSPNCGYVIIDVLFRVDYLNCNGKLCLILDYLSTENIINKLKGVD